MSAAATVNINGTEVSAEFLAQVVEYQEAQKAAKAAARKAERAVELKFLSKLVPVVAEQFEARTFKSKAVGWSFGGKVKVDGRDATVSMLIRWTDTIPAKEKDSGASDAAAVAESVADVDA